MCFLNWVIKMNVLPVKYFIFGNRIIISGESMDALRERYIFNNSLLDIENGINKTLI